MTHGCSGVCFSLRGNLAFLISMDALEMQYLVASYIPVHSKARCVWQLAMVHQIIHNNFIFFGNLSAFRSHFTLFFFGHVTEFSHVNVQR